jgi:NAD(P) transhydrogenase
MSSHTPRSSRPVPTSPAASEYYDLVVIGSGPAGEKGAAQAAYFGKRVCIIERAPKPGGAAINTGTIPSKTLRETAMHFSGLRQRGLYGVEYSVKRDMTVADFMLRERSVVDAEWRLIDDNIRKHDITQIQGAARFIDPQTIEVTRYGEPPRIVSGQVVLIATGARPEPPPDGIPVDGAVILDSETLLSLDRIPASMIVVGGGVIGCEYACIFAALGVRVTLVTNRRRLLAHLDAEVSETLRQQMTSRLGIAVYVDTDVSRVAVRNGRALVTVGENEMSADCLLYCAGRIGASDSLGLEDVGIEVNARGFIVVDRQYRTAVPGVYAAGDVVGFPALASTSMEQARVAMCHAFDLRYKQSLASVVPYGVFTIPEVATVGMTEEELHAKHIEFECGRAFFRANARGQIIGDLEGFVKLVFRPDTQQLLGCSIVGEGASELIHIAMTCIAYDGTIDFFIQSVFNFPTLSEAYKYAAYDGLQAIARRHARKTGLPSGPSRAISA